MAGAREKLDELAILLRDIRMASDLEERMAGGEVEFIGFADGERLMLPVPSETIDRLKSKGQELLALLKQRATQL